jgi:alanine dehydrogenase
VESMKPGSVIIDVAIDQGGCVETSRPTTLSQPTFRVNDVVHFCVPNLTADIPRTASKILTQTHLPYVGEVARSGVKGAQQKMPGLSHGIYLEEGEIRLAELAEQQGS